MLTRLTDNFINLLNRFLSSKAGLFIALICPLAVIAMPQSVRNLENILSSNWIQLWALFVLGYMAVDHKKEIKKLHKHLGIK